MLCVYKPVIIMDPSTGQKNSSSSVSALLNIAGVDANLQALKPHQNGSVIRSIRLHIIHKRKLISQP